MKTLTEELNRNRWYPTPIDRYRSYIKIDTSLENSEQLKSNIAYNLQYLEYIEKQLKELKLSSVITGMLCKTYVITGIGIVEGLFTNLLKSKGEWKSTIWESKMVFQSNPRKIEGIRTRVRTEIFEEVEEFELRMDLNSMVRQIESKKLLTIDQNHFPILKDLRRLRNKVHLQESTDKFDTDVHNFNVEEKVKMGEILYIILTHESFCNRTKDKTLYNFLIED
ncbi:MAG: hypothetical protein GX046_07100 [Tissierellia bacterium]|nr:hypothetical protein [Tissierellia bacterium]